MQQATLGIESAFDEAAGNSRVTQMLLHTTQRRRTVNVSGRKRGERSPAEAEEGRSLHRQAQDP